MDQIQNQLNKYNNTQLSFSNLTTPVQNIRYIFDLINTSGTGQITAEELLIFLINIDSTITLSDTNTLINEYDLNGNGTLSFDEFLPIIGTEITDEKLREAFDSITTDGAVDVNKFRSYYNLLQINPIYRNTNDEYVDIILRMIGNSQEEFIAFWNYINIQTNG
ncbi:Ca2+ BP [Choristoneura rosaceana entomopoxvirus 'L']|uniref:Ca2+ BP n=1 Tax=Choristoneura rosaceana entomopoxvirus 'L' TaxID=1293539 RepID=A0ABP1WLA2_9POXV|nr:Ca2+ BP [Choristoneura rosaceana entomopoxvirus 'L']CCU56132.1 Ca2+ BP [Choristoneura rosaceana entomopoxvirus 'L']